MSQLTDQEARAFLESLFPGGLKDPAVIAELCPEGWENSPLFACNHPSQEVRYEERLAFSRNLKNLFPLRESESGETAEIPPDEPEPKFEEFIATDYMRFYMGTCWLARRADLTPVRAYQEVFRSFPPGWPPDLYPEESQI